MISTLPFGAPLAYSTRGVTAESVKSRKLRSLIKSGDDALFAQIAEHVVQLVLAGLFADYFSPAVTLVPVPGHAPLAPGAVLLTSRIAKALQRAGLAGRFEAILERTAAVPKAAFALPADRPTVAAHLATLSARQVLDAPRRIVLVDDFITRGAMLLSCACRLRVAYPEAEIRGFALVRSITEGEIERIRDPREGVVELLADGQTRRVP